MNQLKEVLSQMKERRTREELDPAEEIEIQIVGVAQIVHNGNYKHQLQQALLQLEQAEALVERLEYLIENGYEGSLKQEFYDSTTGTWGLDP